MRNLLLSIVAVSLLVCSGCSDSDKGDTPAEAHYVELAGKRFEVELATTASKQQLGLSGRASLDADKGMLFIFEREMDLAFYMKDCYFPIDAAFIALDGDDDSVGTILNFTTMAVEKDPSNPVARYRPIKPVRIVLELNGGTLEKLGLKAPAPIKFSPNTHMRGGRPLDE